MENGLRRHGGEGKTVRRSWCDTVDGFGASRKENNVRGIILHGAAKANGNSSYHSYHRDPYCLALLRLHVVVEQLISRSLSISFFFRAKRFQVREVGFGHTAIVVAGASVAYLAQLNLVRRSRPFPDPNVANVGGSSLHFITCHQHRSNSRSYLLLPTNMASYASASRKLARLSSRCLRRNGATRGT